MEDNKKTTNEESAKITPLTEDEQGKLEGRFKSFENSELVEPIEDKNKKGDCSQNNNYATGCSCAAAS